MAKKKAQVEQPILPNSPHVCILADVLQEFGSRVEDTAALSNFPLIEMARKSRNIEDVARVIQLMIAGGETFADLRAGLLNLALTADYDSAIEYETLLDYNDEVPAQLEQQVGQSYWAGVALKKLEEVMGITPPNQAILAGAS